MKEITTARIKDNTLTLPKTATKNWRNADIAVSVSEDTIILKRVAKPNFWETWRKLKKSGRAVNQKDVDNAVKWARSKTYAGGT